MTLDVDKVDRCVVASGNPDKEAGKPAWPRPNRAAMSHSPIPKSGKPVSLFTISLEDLFNDQTLLLSAAGVIRERISATAIYPISAPPITTDTDWSLVNTRGFPYLPRRRRVWTLTWRSIK